MKNLFSKKLLISASIFLLSTNLYSAPKMGTVNIDPAPFKAILDTFYDASDEEANTTTSKISQKNVDAVKPLLLAPSDKNASHAIGGGVSSVLDYKRTKGADLTKVRKVGSVFYNSNNKIYSVSYYYYKEQEKRKTPFSDHFRPIKDKNGKIVWKLMA